MLMTPRPPLRRVLTQMTLTRSSPSDRIIADRATLPSLYEIFSTLVALPMDGKTNRQTHGRLLANSFQPTCHCGSHASLAKIERLTRVNQRALVRAVEWSKVRMTG